MVTARGLGRGPATMLLLFSTQVVKVTNMVTHPNTAQAVATWLKLATSLLSRSTFEVLTPKQN
jgi:hypothetical protein